MPMGDFTYTILKNAGTAIAGLMSQQKQQAGEPSAWMAYFAVSDADAAASKAARLGATVVMPPTDIPDVGRFSIISDPQGAGFAVIKGVPA